MIVNMVALTGLVMATSALPTEMPELAKKLQCDACHAIDKKIVGPAWRDVAKAYNSGTTTGTGKKVSDILAGKTAEEQLLITITEGGSGNWGSMPMPTLDPGRTQQADIKQVVKFILGLASESGTMLPMAVIQKPSVPTISKTDHLLTLAKKYKCAACHSLDGEVVSNKKTAGPAWMEISKAYNSNGVTRTGKKIADILRFHTVEKWLLLKASQGGTGNWGSNVMPANDPDYKHEADIRELVKLILELAR